MRCDGTVYPRQSVVTAPALGPSQLGRMCKGGQLSGQIVPSFGEFFYSLDCLKAINICSMILYLNMYVW